MSSQKLTEEQKQLVEDNIGLAYTMAHKYINQNREKLYHKHLTVEDIKQISLESMCMNAMRYNESKGDFSPYASKSIYLDISRRVNNFNSIKIPQMDSWSGKVHRNNQDELLSIVNSGISSLNTTVNYDEGDKVEIIELLEDFNNDFQESELGVLIHSIFIEDDIGLIQCIIEGYTQTEIARKYKRSQSFINKKIREIKDVLASVLMQAI